MKLLFKSLVLSIVLTFAATACDIPGATLTPDIYWAHQPLAVQALRGHANDADTPAKAMNLATQGQIIDVPIMIWGWDPVCTMGLRLQYGYVWVPSALQPPIEIAPGLHSPGRTSYDPNHPPAGSIIVSVDAKDYPPVAPPPPPPTNKDLVGLCTGNICSVGIGANTPDKRAAAGLKDGSIVTQGGKIYLFHSKQGPFGDYAYFELKGAAATMKKVAQPAAKKR